MAEISTYFGRCRCCLQYNYLKHMWSEYEHNNQTEVYGEMLVECFALTWANDKDSVEQSEQDKICSTCIKDLRNACSFKDMVLQAQETILQELNDDVKDVKIKLESNVDDASEGSKQEDEEHLQWEFLEDDRVVEDGSEEGTEIEYLEDEDQDDDTEIEYLEDDEDSKALFAASVDENEIETKRVRKKRILNKNKEPQEDEDDDGTPKPKYPRKLPKHERNKTYKQYTEEDMRNCLDAIRKNELTLSEAAELFKIPKKTVKAKLRKESKDVQNDTTTKKPTGKLKKRLIKKYKRKKFKKKPTIFRTGYVLDDNSKHIIEQIKLKAITNKDPFYKPLKHESNDYDDNDFKNVSIDVDIKKEIKEDIDYPVNAEQIRSRYKALVNAKFNKHSKEETKSDVNELNKHKDNIKAILENSNATLIKGFWGARYSCYFCKEQREFPFQLKQHNLEVHRTEADNAVKVKYVSDLVIRIDMTDLRCKLCEANISSLEDLKVHLSEEHTIKIHKDIKNYVIPFIFNNNGQLQCVKCRKEFKYFKLLSEHMSEHYRNYECPVCARPFINRQSLKTHSYRHRSGTFKCSQCPKVFDTKPNRSVHERVIHALSNKTRKCGYCDERFSTKDLVQTHEVKVHGVEPTVFSCQACNKSYNRHSSLMTHMKRYHLMLRPHKCSYCDMAFFSRIELRSHTVIHTKSREFKCGVCSKCFGTRSSLNQHLRGHLDERRFQCNNCERAFVHRTGLRLHMRSKHGQIV